MQIYLIIINIISFLLYGIDKYKAKHEKWRIPEYILLLSGLIGGSIGSILGMVTFRHKTKKIKFKVLNILFLIIQIIILKNL